MRPLILALLFVTLTGPSVAQDKKKAEPKAPRIVMVIPLGAAPGKTTKLILRGFGLENAQEVRVEGATGSAKIVAKGKAAVPDKNPEKVGDTQVEIALTLDAKLPDGPLSVVVVTPEGTTTAHRILIEMRLPVLEEKEPNDGFRQAQALQPPAVIEGRIERPRDVDVYRIDGKAGQKLIAEVQASRDGSPLDAILTLYSHAGQELASNDDFADSRDAQLEVTLPADGVYYLSLIDAHDTGSALHAYELQLTAK